MTIKGIIFDLDGVLCSTDDFHYKAWKTLADRLGIPFDHTVNNRMRGVSRMDSLNILLERSEMSYSDPEKLLFAEEKNAIYREQLLQMSTLDLDETVRSALRQLRCNGILLAVGSSSKNAPTILQQLGLSDFFDAVVSGNDIVHSKPHPEVFLKAAAALGFPPTDCLVVEDAAAGVQAAVAGGFPVAGIGEASGHPHCTYKISCISDIMEICLSTSGC